MNKIDLRKKYKALRKQLSDVEIEQKSLMIANQLLKLAIWDKTNYHLFLTIERQKEIETDFVLQILAGKDKNCIVSKSNFDTRELIHYLLTDSTKFIKNDYGIPEPIDGIEVSVNKIDVVFVPLLAFDTKGNRVGYGKGFYDIFLQKCNPDTVKIGLSFFEAETVINEILDTDVQLNYCVTPSNIYKF